MRQRLNESERKEKSRESLSDERFCLSDRGVEANCDIDWNGWTGEMPATLMFVVSEGRVLLIKKQRGIGAGKINGPGGKIDPGETAFDAAVRETQEELVITPLNPVKMGELCFAMSDIPDIYCHVYMARDFEGEPTETEEAIPVWFDIADIPYAKMWQDDAYWLPQMLEGQTFMGRFTFEGDLMTWHDVQFGDVQDQWIEA